jgi:hypothetical protein
MAIAQALKLVGNTGYTHPVAKVLISIPDDLLRELDLRVENLGETRSGYLQGLVESDFAERERQGREKAIRILDEIKAEFSPHEKPIDAAQLIREDRESH